MNLGQPFPSVFFIYLFWNRTFGISTGFHGPDALSPNRIKSTAGTSTEGTLAIFMMKQLAICPNDHDGD